MALSSKILVVSKPSRLKIKPLNPCLQIQRVDWPLMSFYCKNSIKIHQKEIQERHGMVELERSLELTLHMMEPPPAMNINLASRIKSSAFGE